MVCMVRLVCMVQFRGSIQEIGYVPWILDGTDVLGDQSEARREVGNVGDGEDALTSLLLLLLYVEKRKAATLHSTIRASTGIDF